MDAQRKPDGTFLPGHRLSTGRPAIPHEVRTFTRELRTTILKTLQADPAYLAQVLSNQKASNLELIVARYVVESGKGSIPHLELLLERAIGAAPKYTEQADDQSAEVVDLIPREALVKALTEHYDKQRSVANK